MSEELKKKIRNLLDKLSDEEKSQEILELENIPKNEQIISYLENLGAIEITYKMNSVKKPGSIQEKGGITYLWHKNSNGIWIIKLWEINRMMD